MNLADFNMVDYIALGIILLWTLVGFRQGLTGQIAFMLTGLIVLAVAAYGYTPCRDWILTRSSLPPELARLVALGVVLVVPLVVVLGIYHLMDYILKVTFTKWMDRLGGALFGFASSVAFIILAFILLNLLPVGLRPPGVGHESWIGRRLVGVEGELAEKIKSRIKDTRTGIHDARETRTSKREKWEE
jgi:uncharacterized membrane protein required for colicin V production